MTFLVATMLPNPIMTRIGIGHIIWELFIATEVIGYERREIVIIRSSRELTTDEARDSKETRCHIY